MILTWTTSKIVVSRIMRNIKGVEAEYMESFPEWIAEAVRKMRTNYSLEIKHKDIDIEFFQGKLDCPGEAIICVEHCGTKLRYNNSDGQRFHNCEDDFISNLFLSINPIYTAAGDLVDEADPRSKFPRDIIVHMDALNWHGSLWYNLNYNKLQTNLKCGTVRVWYSALPTDPDDWNFPMIPDVENYLEAVYWYCRMKLIEAGFEDKIFSHDVADGKWEMFSGRAIADITYPTPDQVEASIARHCVLMFPSEYNWRTFNEQPGTNTNFIGGVY